MNNLIDNWFVIVAIVVLLIFVGIMIFAFLKQPSEGQLRKIKEWLLFAVTQAEVELGTGTGRLKLRYVYDLFITKFKWFAYLISFEAFSDLVDDALDEMRDMLATNRAVYDLVAPDGDLGDV
ncbi:hypothetical protein [Sporosarcina sp. FSL K6-5500]|uniref:hypothetical protein n=1 Tax=Sporosarcina sp. FSL K6-5500 TaxID=2921558 RepID=UPI0030FD04F7